MANCVMMYLDNLTHTMATRSDTGASKAFVFPEEPTEKCMNPDCGGCVDPECQDPKCQYPITPGPPHLIPLTDDDWCCKSCLKNLHYFNTFVTDLKHYLIYNLTGCFSYRCQKTGNPYVCEKGKDCADCELVHKMMDFARDEMSRREDDFSKDPSPCSLCNNDAVFSREGRGNYCSDCG
jgi:hypothetical protein